MLSKQVLAERKTFARGRFRRCTLRLATGPGAPRLRDGSLKLSAPLPPGAASSAEAAARAPAAAPAGQEPPAPPAASGWLPRRRSGAASSAGPAAKRQRGDLGAAPCHADSVPSSDDEMLVSAETDEALARRLQAEDQGGNHLSDATCLTHAFFKTGEECIKLN